MAAAVDVDALRAWIGREERAEETLPPALVRRFAATFDGTFPDTPGAEAPPLIHFCLTQPAAPTASLGTDGHPARGGFLPPVPLPRRMWAGGEVEFVAAIRVGDAVERRSVIRDVAVKQGGSGTLCFVTVEHEIVAGGRLAVRERQDIVYRGAGKGAAAAARPAVASPEGTERMQVVPSPPLLFRYSALTFNGHRIHYDRPYATAEEGYPGLVVHGPLQATLLCLFAARLNGATPRRFAFRSLSAIHDDRAFTLNARSQPDGLRLWTAAEDGPVAMEALASW